ncbi:MAG: DUF4236 domain-containing protein [Hyphomicrobiaceae bacterium]|nr:DUF4236 domain-containing protein [Hyphomicrobiaceae bacterium]
MGFRFRRSKKLLPGIKLTISHRGASVRVGPRGAGVSVSTTGRKTINAGIPGTGLGIARQFSNGRRREDRKGKIPPRERSWTYTSAGIVAILFFLWWLI